MWRYKNLPVMYYYHERCKTLCEFIIYHCWWNTSLGITERPEGMSVVIHVPCIVSCTSIFTRQMFLVTYFFICWLEWLSRDQVVGGIVVFPPMFLGELFHRDILLIRCCLQMIAATKTCSKNFSAASSPIFTWGSSKYCPSLHFT